MEKDAIWAKAKTTVSFVQKHAVLFTLLLVLALQFVPSEGNAPWGSIWMRMQTKNLDIAENVASSNVDNFIQQQVASIAQQRYPNLPEANRQKVINDLKLKFQQENKATLDVEKGRLAKQVRDHFSYEENGKLYSYMPDIDPYHYLRLARNVLNTGHNYDELHDGVPWDNHMSAPVGTGVDNSWHSYVIAGFYKVNSLVNKNVPFMDSAAYIGIFLIFLSLIFIFFAGYRLGGKLSGFFAVIVLGLIPAIMTRTPWGHIDTDMYVVFFPALILFLLFETFFAESWKKQIMFACGTGVAISLFASFWSGWFFFADIIFGAVGLVIIIEIVLNRKKFRHGFVSLLEETHLKKHFIAALCIFVSGFVVSLFTIGVRAFWNGIFYNALNFRTIKSAAGGTIWPNVLTTVAELNPASFSMIISSVGGMLVFVVACFGILLSFSKRDQKNKREFVYSLILALWFVGSVYASLKGARFTLLLGPAVAIAFGAAAGFGYKYLSDFGKRQLHIHKYITGVVLLGIFSLMIINPALGGSNMAAQSYSSVRGSIPMVNDAWWAVLTKIKEESAPDAIITSWWDFGHHFKYIADRQVTFDGASQTSPQAHWIGRVLQTEDEREAIGILRLNDCGSNTAQGMIFEKLNDSFKTVEIIKTIIMQNKSSARDTLRDAGLSEDILQFTHCDPPENYFIVSPDMIGKAGVWSHFGMWDFKKAEVWLEWRHLPEKDAVAKMMNRFNWTEEKSKEIYKEAKALTSEDSANGWISGYPGYVTHDVQGCKVSGSLLVCGSLQIDITNGRGELSVDSGKALAKKVIIYNEKGEKQVFTSSEGNDQLTFIVWPVENGMSAIAANDALADSMFTRLFYMNGLGLKHFDLFARDNQLFGGPVYVWKVDWEGKDAYVPQGLLPKTSVISGAQVALNYIGWTDDGVFDSSIVDWRSKNVSSDSDFDSFETKPLAFIIGNDQLIPGFEKRIEGMMPGEIKTITVPPKEGYGVDPNAHPLGNKTLKFKIRVESIR
ncbi:hypothetical protein COV18_02155 [Candidatus Woesearchaeota archaeon CG10_big_fil_rev_8_21_14_0_10_37_12]|nr:MAG: hypothetical protein COV18_02155 [Candidatus Woesearchaeota archaeon CG10_big_fil_rev_8_21_14_0_10_37_12]